MEENHLIKERINKVHEIRENGVNPYPYSFDKQNDSVFVNEKYASLASEEKSKDSVSVAGRIMQFRKMGKASFAHIQDEKGRVQIYLRQDDIGEDSYKIAKKLDIGDIVGVKGTIFKTKMGEVTVYAKEFELLCKSIRPLPEKYHGLKDKELRYRQRYLDLIMNQDVKDTFVKRSLMIKTVRAYFDELKFMEVETPLLQTQYGGANAKPFITHINAWDMQMFLSISPELYLKRLVVGGFEKVYTICKNFRNEGVDHSHNPEFTMLEVYQAYADYTDMMKIIEECYEKCAIALSGSTKITQVVKGEEVVLDFKAPWKRLTMAELISEHAKIDVLNSDVDTLKQFVKDNKVELGNKKLDNVTWGDLTLLIFEEYVEEKLIQPVHVIDHPVESTPLCKAHRSDDRLIERFESFALGMELCNAYSELNDPIKQKELFAFQEERGRAGDDEAHPMDTDYINSLEIGMAPTGGLGFGIDRMAILLTGVESIRDIILFPTMKPQEKVEVQKAKDTNVAVVLVNKGIKLESWQVLNTIGHLNAAFGARKGKELLYKDTIETKDKEEIKLNIQHAIMIKEIDSNEEILDLISKAKSKNLEIAEFTQEMIETNDDKKVIEVTKDKNLEEIKHLGVLVYGNKKDVDSLTKKYGLYK